MPGFGQSKDPSTPVRRKSTQQARRPAESLGRTPPSAAKNYSMTPTRSSARLHQLAGSPEQSVKTPLPSATKMTNTSRTRRRGRGPPGQDVKSDTVGGPATRLKRSRPSISYGEATSSSESSSDDSSTDEASDTDRNSESGADGRLPSASQGGRRSSARLRKAKVSPNNRVPASPHSTKQPRKAVRLPSGERRAVQQQGAHRKTSGPTRLTSTVIPDWQGSLPHLIWVQILTYAAFAPGPFEVDVSCLLKLAKLCKATLDPAITVLYRNPPISTEQKLIGLITLLRRPPSRLMFNYRSRIRALYLDLSVLSLATGTYGSFQNLIQNLAQLSNVAIVHPLDKPPYRSLDATIRWHYPEDLFRGLQVAEDASEDLLDKTTPTRLTSWTWNERFVKQGTHVEGLASIQQIHLGESFHSLRRVKFVNFQLPSVRAGGSTRKSEEAFAALRAKDEEHTQLMADALAALPHLTHVAFESSTSANTELLPLLPRGLKSLELINCWEITSDAFSSFLLSHGHSLESLVLHSNQALSLSFLTILAQTCPSLTELRMNLLYYRHHEFLDDSDPFYDVLLREDEIPSWPPQLRVIDMENLRGWSADAANMFFQSLFDNAACLRDLRHLSIKAMIDIPWRERSGIRQGWQDKLTKVFLRPLIPPTRLTSLRRHPAKVATKQKAPAISDNSSAGPSRRSSRLMVESAAAETRLQEQDASQQDDSRDQGVKRSRDQVPLPVRTSGRLGNTQAVDDDGVPVVSGLCEVVEIVIDNQKPREQQFGMDDFLDEMDTSGSEGDAEWNGR
ncbi:hypothetical protein F5X68DRAFT_35518 [Plectosphaerella plurivora]|uniref:Uncharacterized protein n=1 Tax=Plectosphaerella plurivora TaxID=936078 RepID=A0A9P9A843_9PEZI|nr:hypothetical protein F5X68DRAFT_35518 [Plectosphaerella plurivora]